MIGKRYQYSQKNKTKQKIKHGKCRREKYNDLSYFTNSDLNEKENVFDIFAIGQFSFLKIIKK